MINVQYIAVEKIILMSLKLLLLKFVEVIMHLIEIFCERMHCCLDLNIN